MAKFPISSYDRTVSIAVLCASIGSIIFAVFMIGGYIFIPSLLSRLILGLAIAELFVALNFFAGSISSLVGEPLSSPLSSTFCSFNGFITQVFFLMIDCWVLAIALMTYLTIADKSRATHFVQRHQAWLWIAIWLFSIACSSIGFGIWGYSNIAGMCWFKSQKLRLILNFVPRWIVIIVTMYLYCRTFVLIRQAQRTGLMRAVCGGGAARPGNSYPEGTAPLPSFPSTAAGTYSSSGSTARFTSRSGEMRRESNYSVLERQCERERQHDRLRRTSFLMTAYPICYAILWSIPTIILIYELTNLQGKRLPVGLDCLSKVTIALNGFVSGHIYGFNERSQIAWVNMVISTVLRIKKADDRRASCASAVGDWNAYSVRVDELQISDRRESKGNSVAAPIITNRAVDVEKGPHSP